MGAGGTWRAVFYHVLIALTEVEAEISASNSDERELGIARDRTGEMTRHWKPCASNERDEDQLLQCYNN